MASVDDGTRRIARAPVFVDEPRLIITVGVVDARRRHVAQLAILASCTSLNLINSVALRVRRLCLHVAQWRWQSLVEPAVW